MKLSVFYDHILNASKQTGLSVSEVLNRCAEAGIQAVELDLFHFEESTDHLALLRSAGMQTACVNAFYTMENGFDKERAEAHIRAAAVSGAKKILVVPGFLTEEEGITLSKVIHDRNATFSFLESCPNAVKIAEGLRRITEMALPYGIAVTVEDFDNVASPLSGLNSLLWYLNSIPSLHCTFDTGNFITHNDDLFEAWDQLKDRVIHVHCKDRGAGPVAIGDGALPCGDILSRIARERPAEYVAIEHYGAADQMTCIRRSAAFIRGLSL